ncbi:MAG: hypothetical protein QOI10_527 [Solirubrobacterales bacterium]|jgi:PST family polysaccharide transporter|nr:hypothetical protein [Solirubrobacterales bacterium]
MATPQSEIDAATVVGRRRRTARGAVINSAFLVGLGTINLLKSFIVVGIVSAAEFGVWSIVVLAVYLVIAIKAVAVADKYVQQREPDQEAAFQRAFTLELGAALIATLAMAVLAPVLALVYGDASLLAPALVIALVLPGLALQSPIWIFYRRLDFLHQRLLMAVDPLVGFVVTIALAAAGLGYWSLVIGMVAGAWSAGLAAIALCPYRLRLRFDRGSLREYLTFSWPLMLATGLGLMIAQLSVFFGNAAIGLAAAGSIGLAGTLSTYADRVDSVVTQTIYPVICRVTDRRDLLLEAFVKSNRLALMWAVPFGVGVTLFVSDLITYGIGEQWRDADLLLATIGLTAAVNHIGFNWNAFYRAVGNTRPVAIVTGLGLTTFLAVAVPGLYIDGLDGFAVGIAAMTAVSLAARWVYVRRLFPDLRFARHGARAIAPTIPAAAAVIAARLLEGGDRSGELALLELLLYIAVTLIATWFFERDLITEIGGYLRRERLDPGAAPAASPSLTS